MTRWYSRAARQCASLALTTLLGGILCATMVRLSPGFGTDERLLDPGLDPGSRAAIRAELGSDERLPRFYVRYFQGMLHGNLGTSASLQRPIGELIRARLPFSLRMIGAGLAGGWLLAFALALASVLWRGPECSRVAGALSVMCLCVPSAAVAVLVFCWGGPVRAVLTVVLFPRLFDYLRNLLRDAYGRPHVLAARARGLHPARMLAAHVLPVCAPQLLALAGISASMAFGAAIPIETLCDLPGIGQLAWKAAVARDLPVLVSLTMLLALATQLCNAASDWATACFPWGRA